METVGGDTQLIKQRGPRDCFLACLAMAYGWDYDRAIEAWGPEFVAHVNEKGTYGQASVRQAFAAFGAEMGRDYHSILGPASGVPAEYVVPTAPFKLLLWGRRALVQVPSKNFGGESHILYWDGFAIHDPSNLRTYQTWDEVNPQHVWIIRDVVHPNG